MKKLWMVFPLLLLSQVAFSAHHFTDIYQTENGWRVDHFSAEQNKLQKLVESRGFRYRVLAQKYADDLASKFPQEKSFLISSREENVAPLWTVTRAWNADWERKYSDWVAKEFTADFFTKTNLATDCADVAYALRWIFSRNNQLPAAATLGGSGKIVTHLTASAEWNSLPGNVLWYKDQRFMTALRWLLDMVYTKTLYVDAYPVKIGRDTIRPGLINLIGAHSEVFSQVSFEKGQIPFLALSSTVPQAVRVLSSRVYMDSEPIPKKDGGLLHFRWPLKTDQGWKITAREKMPDYSLEQFNPNLCQDQGHFTFCMLEILKIDYDAELIAKKLISDLSAFLTTRIQVVKDGVEFCSKNDCSLPGVGYEDWSTPSRDKRLAKNFANTYEVLTTLDQTQVFKEWIESATIFVPFEMRVQDFRDRLQAGLVSYDPRVSIEERWAKDEPAIESHLRHRYAEINDARGALITKAQACRSTPETCMRDGKSFRSLSTVEMDQELRNLYSNWMDYASKNGMQTSKESEAALFALWRKSPAPWDSLSERLGLVQGTGHFLKAKHVDQAAPGFIILDHKQLYDIEKRALVDLGNITGLYYDEASDKYLAHDRRSLQVLDSNFQGRVSFELMGYRDDLVFVHSFGNGTVFIAECMYDDVNCYGTKSGWPLNLKTLSAGDAFRFFNVHREKDRPESILFADKEFSSLISNGDSIETAYLTQVENPGQIIHLKGHEYLVTTGNKMGIMNEKAFEVLLTNRGMADIERLNSNFIAYGNWKTGTQGYFDIKNHTLTKLEFELGPDTAQDRRMGVVFSRDLSSGLLFDGDTLSTIPLKLKFDYAPIVTAAKNWFSLETGNVQDYKGLVLESSDYIMKGLCQGSKYNSLCLGVNENVLLEYFMSPYNGDEHYYTYARMGKNSGRKMSEIYAYGIVENLSQTSLSLTDKDTVMPEAGTSIPVGNTHIIWFP